MLLINSFRRRTGRFVLRETQSNLTKHSGCLVKQIFSLLLTIRLRRQNGPARGRFAFLSRRDFPTFLSIFRVFGQWPWFRPFELTFARWTVGDESDNRKKTGRIVCEVSRRRCAPFRAIRRRLRDDFFADGRCLGDAPNDPTNSPLPAIFVRVYSAQLAATWISCSQENRIRPALSWETLSRIKE